MKTVKAAVMVEPGQIELQEFPYPKNMKDGLIVKMELSGICGSDKHTYLGQSKQYAGTAAETDTPFPIIPGHENVGIIEEIYSKDNPLKDFNGNELKVGDRITMCPDVVCGECWYCKNTFGFPWCDHNKAYGNAFSITEYPSLFGGWAQYIYIKPETFIYKVPKSISPEVAVLSELFTVAIGIDATKECYSLANTGFGAFPTVVIIGVGPLGLCSLIRTRIMGAGTIIVIDKSNYRLDAAKKFSADYTINVRDICEKDRLDYVKSLTSGRGSDIVIGCAGDPKAFSEGLNMLRKAGTYIELGNFIDTGTTEINVSRQICIKNARVIGIGNHPYTEYDNTLKIFEKYKDQFPFEELVSHCYPLEKTEEALLKSMELDSLKVVISPNL